MEREVIKVVTDDVEPDSSTLAKLFSYQLNLKIYHWQTRNYARHLATDELISALAEFTDAYAELVQGALGHKRIEFHSEQITLYNYPEEENGKELLHDVYEFVLADLYASVKSWDIHGLENKWQDLEAVVLKTMYKFSLE